MRSKRYNSFKIEQLCRKRILFFSHFSMLGVVYTKNKFTTVLSLRSSMSSVQSTAAGHVRQNSSAHKVCSRAAIWTLISFKWSQLYLLLICLIWRTCITCQASWMTRSFLNLSKEECEYLIMMHIPYTPLSETRNPWPLCNFIENCLFSMMTNTWLMKRKC